MPILKLTGSAREREVENCAVPSIDIGRLLLALEYDVAEIAETLGSMQQAPQWGANVSVGSGDSVCWVSWASIDAQAIADLPKDANLEEVPALFDLLLPRELKPDVGHECNNELLLYKMTERSLFVTNILEGNFDFEAILPAVVDRDQQFFLDSSGRFTIPIEEDAISRMLICYQHNSTDNEFYWFGCGFCGPDSANFNGGFFEQELEEAELIELLKSVGIQLAHLLQTNIDDFLTRVIEFLDEIDPDGYDVDLAALRRNVVSAVESPGHSGS